MTGTPKENYKKTIREPREHLRNTLGNHRRKPSHWMGSLVIHLRSSTGQTRGLSTWFPPQGFSSAVPEVELWLSYGFPMVFLSCFKGFDIGFKYSPMDKQGNVPMVFLWCSYHVSQYLLLNMSLWFLWGCPIIPVASTTVSTKGSPGSSPKQ